MRMFLIFLNFKQLSNKSNTHMNLITKNLQEEKTRAPPFHQAPVIRFYVIIYSYKK